LITTFPPSYALIEISAPATLPDETSTKVRKLGIPFGVVDYLKNYMLF
jgi:hypothetical protein